MSAGASSSTSCWPQAPGAKSPFVEERPQRLQMRRDDRLAAAAGHQREQRRDDQHAALARGAHQRREPVRQRRDGGIALPGAAIGAVGMEEIVLQIAEDQRAGRRVHHAALHDQIAERDRRGRQARLDHGRGVGLLEDGRPCDACVRPADRAATRSPVSRQPPSNQTGRVPRRGLVERRRRRRARRPRSRTPAAGRSPRRAATRCGPASPGSRRLNDAEIGRLECRADHGSR